MSTTGLFVIGVLVTLIVVAAMTLLVYAAILDGRDASSRQAAEREPPASLGGDSLLQTARSAGSFATLISAIDAAGLSDVLEHEGPYTVFAPSDEAFARLPRGAVESLLAARRTLTDVVNYHLVPERITAADIAGRVSAKTLQGEDLVISNSGAVRVDGARIVSGDIEASNGVIHIIDRVLLPARI